MEKLSVSLEDYIEEIYTQVLKSGQAKVTLIADALGVKKASVTGALNTLSDKKLINYAPYSSITLTNEGEKIAKNILQKHENICEFFKVVLNIPEMSFNPCLTDPFESLRYRPVYQYICYIDVRSLHVLLRISMPH